MSNDRPYLDHPVWTRVAAIRSLLEDGPAVTTSEGQLNYERLRDVFTELSVLADAPHPLVSLSWLAELDSSARHSRARSSPSARIGWPSDNKATIFG